MADKVAYINIELPDTDADPAQIIILDEPRDDLEEAAVWQSIPVSAANAILKERAAKAAAAEKAADPTPAADSAGK